MNLALAILLNITRVKDIMMHEETIIHGIALILLGIVFSQYFSWLIKIPAIIPLMIFGFVLGPLTGQINPEAILNGLMNPLIEIAVAIILFEGGLNLRFNELKEISFGLKRLISLGLVFNWVLGACAAHYVANLTWEISMVLAAILVVTGPTVVIPVLRHAKINKRVSSFLKWEGIINDPLGVLLISIIYQILVIAPEDFIPYIVFISLIKALSISFFFAFITGFTLKKMFEKALFPDYLKVPAILSITILLFIFTDELHSGAGLLSTTVFGIYFGNQNMHVINELRRFKETITIMAVSFIFIILTASIPLEIFTNLDWRTCCFIVLIVFLVRPLALFLATIKSEMLIKERLLIGLFAPRGVVAASVAGLVGISLAKKGFPGAELILPIVFVVILSTVLIHGLGLRYLAKALGLSIENSNGIVIVGASSWAIELASLLETLEIPILLSDSNWQRLKKARQRGLNTHYGQILVDAETGKLDLSEYKYLLAGTANDAYNALVCSGLSSDFESSNIYQLPINEKDLIDIEELPADQSGKALESEDLLYDNLKEKYFQGWVFKHTTLTDEYDYKNFIADNPEQIKMLLVKANKQLVLMSNKNKFIPAAEDIVVYMHKAN